MRSLLFAAVLLVAATSQAEVKAIGTFVPSLCSNNDSNGPGVQIVGVQTVCVGRLEGMNQQAVELSLNDGKTRVYSITMNGRLGGMGSSRAEFGGEQVTKSRKKDKISGIMSMTSGITTTYGISLTTKSNLHFQGSLWQVAVTQSR